VLGWPRHRVGTEWSGNSLVVNDSSIALFQCCLILMCFPPSLASHQALPPNDEFYTRWLRTVRPILFIHSFIYSFGKSTYCSNLKSVDTLYKVSTLKIGSYAPLPNLTITTRIIILIMLLLKILRADPSSVPTNQNSFQLLKNDTSWFAVYRQKDTHVQGKLFHVVEEEEDEEEKK